MPADFTDPKGLRMVIANDEDLPCVAELLAENQSDWSKTELLDSFRQNDCIVLAQKNNFTLGMVVVRKTHQTAEILQLLVSEKHRHQGVARQLLHFIFEKMHQDGVKKWELEVRASNQFAIALYEKIGFEKVGLRKKYYRDGEDAVLMDWWGDHETP